MIPNRRHLAATIGLALVAAAAPALARQPSPDESALAGPKVEPARAGINSLVRHDFDGKLKRLDSDPVAAALDLLDLDKPTRAAADDVLGVRVAALDAIMADNLREVAELNSARLAGDQARARELLRDLLAKAGPMFKKGPLVDQVAEVLPTEKGAELKRLVEEYVQAAIEDRMENGAPAADGPPLRKQGPGKPTKMQANMAERLTGFGAEVRRSYERVFGNRAKDFQQTVAELGLSPEQESKVQQIFTDLFQKTYGKPTRQQSTRAFLQAYVLLDTEQRAKLRERMAGRADAPAVDSPEPPMDIPTPTR